MGPITGACMRDNHEACGGILWKEKGRAPLLCRCICHHPQTYAPTTEPDKAT